MKISTKGRYGLRILLDLAMHLEEPQPRMLKDIADSQSISEKYISRLVIALRQAKLVQSVRGAKGGYRLARNPSEITLLEVVEIMEGPIGVVECTSPETGSPCSRSHLCAAHSIWEGVNAVFRNTLAEITLQSIIDRQKEINADLQCWDYCI